MQLVQKKIRTPPDIQEISASKPTSETQPYLKLNVKVYCGN